MRLLRIVADETNIPFMRFRKLFIAISSLAVVLSVVLVLVKGMNFGIDFQGGILIEVRMPQAADMGKMRGQLGGLGLGEVSLQEFGDPSDVLIRIGAQEGDETAQQAAINQVKQALGEGVDYRRVEFVGPKVSSELLLDGVLAVAVAIIAMLIYIWLRFEWQFGLGAVMALTHDVFLTLGVFSLLGLEFNLSTVAAVLTIAGYSINDTVVVFDRIREDLRKFKSKPIDELLNGSINATLSRTLMTSLTTLVALLALFFLGGEVIRDFSFAMIFGILIGTYSSICVAAPLLLYTNVASRARSGGADAEAEEAAETP
ncbi:MAG TPA: protein translocase subunit SecF [Rhodospirillaceae bacterium]|nr:protein translocase subunit SecF [Rhodospirillaceae bacterium]|tara:strand:+ start:1083 stop:2027 length:945 start_codon:yes stop_codon:yes gene_type:complete